MRTGKLTISRGHELLRHREEQPAVQPVSFSPCRETGELHRIQVRLNALERLTRLFEQGAISLDEFKLEKSLVLRLTAEELLLTSAAPRDRPAPAPIPANPSLLGRLLGWRSALLALVGAGAFQLWSQPEATLAWLSDLSALTTG